MSHDLLVRRIEILESRQKKLVLGLLAAFALGACGGVTSHYEACFSRSFAVEKESGGAVLARLAEDPAKGGLLEVTDNEGKVRVVIDANGVRTLDAQGKEKWASPK